ncbi:MAG: hypothetical protein Q8N51_01160 [Gammaproteobacteria bacterium]|nr:hypothetical protein [Gammaproteobacteria bacterium]
MVSLMSLIVPILVAAVFVFIASSIIHMATPLHKGDLKRLANEDDVMAALRPFNLAPGDYAMPLASSMAGMGTPEFQAKMEKGPVVVMTVRPSGKFTMTPNLIQWFVYSIVVSLVAGYVATAALAPGAPYLKVFQVTGCVAFTGYALGLPQASIWGGKNWGATLRGMFGGLIYGLLTGGTFGWLWP